MSTKFDALLWYRYDWVFFSVNSAPILQYKVQTHWNRTFFQQWHGTTPETCQYCITVQLYLLYHPHKSLLFVYCNCIRFNPPCRMYCSWLIYSIEQLLLHYFPSVFYSEYGAWLTDSSQSTSRSSKVVASHTPKYYEPCLLHTRRNNSTVVNKGDTRRQNEKNKLPQEDPRPNQRGSLLPGSNTHILLNNNRHFYLTNNENSMKYKAASKHNKIIYLSLFMIIYVYLLYTYEKVTKQGSKVL